jgi:hypothetical protein
VNGLVCPSCGGAFRAGFTRCAPCGVDLVDAAVHEEQRRRLVSPRAALEGVAKVALLHAGLPACREVERALLAEGVPCVVEAHAEEGEALAPGAMKVGVMVGEPDLPRAIALLRRQFEDLVAREGVGSFSTEAVDVSAAEVTCPACNHRGSLTDGACADCGLHLGVPEG